MSVQGDVVKNSPLLDRIETKMRSAEIGSPTIAAFLNAVRQVAAGEGGLMPENSIEPVQALPALESVSSKRSPGVLQELAVIKLNGGLGTGMGLDRAKSLIPVKGSDTFLDFIARQIFHLRGGRTTSAPAFFLMNSFATRADSLDYLSRYPELGEEGRLDFLQNKVPKLDAETLEPISWPADPELEWCPPGHGDFYPALLGNGVLDRLLKRGIRYCFVSNSDNLGATVDLALAHYFAESGLSFLMEVAERTPADRKGGHLARRRTDERLVLRESAQCPKEDEPHFQNIERHRYFNTNNLWIRLDHLQAELDRRGNVLSLPLIKNTKPVDPQNVESRKVLQLESAMGAAIECFERSGAIIVPRSRFSPVKTTSDLLALRSDAYEITEDFRLVLAPARRGRPPVIELDSPYKLMGGFEALFPEGPPSLIHCDSLKVIGPNRFSSGVICRGNVEIMNRSGETKRLKAGTYSSDCGISDNHE
jgi:UDP-N-acetylglucosamine pyrophosphorylase